MGIEIPQNEGGEFGLTHKANFSYISSPKSELLLNHHLGGNAKTPNVRLANSDE